MDLLGPIVEIIVFLWSPISRQIGYLKNLNHHISTLSREIDELKCMHDEVQAQVDVAVSAGMTRLPRVQKWLEDVGRTVGEVDSIRLELERGRTRCCCVGLNSGRKLGRRAIRKKKEVEMLRQKGGFSQVCESPRRSQTPEMQVPQDLQKQSTSKETLKEIWQFLEEDEVGIICVWGMGGIGKTALMKEIYSRLNAAKYFHQVIWVTVSKDLNLEVIQKKIGSKLGLQFRAYEGIDEKRDRLHARLKNLRYMLILDDLWRDFSLDEVGIPHPNNQHRSKIVITSRLNEVSNAMEADRKIKVKPLRSEEAWNLFCSKTDNVILLPEIRPLAEQVVKECGGLPLAIITVGRAMRHKDKKELWQHALKSLKGSAPEIRGMEREVFLPLKLSYGYLEDSKIQSFFLYCSLYPEDDEIKIKDLVRCWASEEGLVNNFNSLDDAVNKGHDMLEKLKDACLLEESSLDSRCVRMHDLLRDLAIWITSPSSSCFQAPKSLVKAGVGVEQPPEEKMWEGMRRISLIRNQITELQMMPTCLDLVSLFLRENYRLRTIQGNFFQLMPKLQILDLKYTGIESLPPSLSLLANLRVLIASHCEDLKEIPPLGDLKELQLLDLHRTSIKNLPQGIASPPKLKFLDLSHMYELATIPINVISGLTTLEDLWLSGEMPMVSFDTWQEVAKLPLLNSLKIQLSGFGAFMENVMKNPIWSRLGRFFVRFGSKDMYPATQFGRIVQVFDCKEIPSQINFNSLLRNAEELLIKQCQGAESFSQIIGDSPSLKFINLDEVEGVKCIIDWREVGVGENNALGCLEELNLFSLPSLHKVFDGRPPTGFQQLRRISIGSCPKLMCVFSASMSKHLHGLEELWISDCEEIVEIVEAGWLPETALQRLWYLSLRKLPKLETICSQQLPLRCMKCIDIAGCPELKKLPVLSSDIQAKTGKIEEDEEWWERIELNNEHSKSLYSTIYTKKGEPRFEADSSLLAFH